jgi:hypothetical protein
MQRRSEAFPMFRGQPPRIDHLTAFGAERPTIPVARHAGGPKGSLEMCIERVGDRVLIVAQVRLEQSLPHKRIEFGFM